MAVMDVSILIAILMENVSQAITQGGGCLTLHSKWKSAFDDSEASDNETRRRRVRTSRADVALLYTLAAPGWLVYYLTSWR